MLTTKSVIGKRIKKTRINKNISVSNLANYLNVSSKYIVNVELGKTFLSFKYLNKLCEYLEVNPDYLIFGDFYHQIEPTLKNINEKEKEELKDILKNML